MMTRTALLSAATALAMAFAAAPAMAGSPDGTLQVKLLGTAVLPDGKITEVLVDGIGLPAGSQTYADDSYVPTIAIEYFVTPQISIETICCVTQHDVNGRGALAGAGLVSNAHIISAKQAESSLISGRGHPTSFSSMNSRGRQRRRSARPGNG